jgi:hypothetical protein
MNMNIKGLEDFKLVMATITQVQALTITAEVKYRGMQEIFHMLRQHGIDVSLFCLKPLMTKKLKKCLSAVADKSP